MRSAVEVSWKVLSKNLVSGARNFVLRPFRRHRQRVLRSRVEVTSVYQLPGTINLDPSYEMMQEGHDPGFEEGFLRFKEELLELVAVGRPTSYFKFGDGDYHFLMQSEVGSAKPGRRALSLPYSDIDHGAFVVGSRRCDRYMCELYPSNRSLFQQALPGVAIDWWADYAYAAVASRWVTAAFNGKIGLIGSKSKLKLVRALMESSDYRAYLGTDTFADYIEVPDRFACDNLDWLSRDVASQLEQATSQIFLVGVGHVKSGLLWRLPDQHPAVYLDVGSGIDALAGVIDRFRPYFGGWLNFRLPEKPWYDGLDTLQVADLGSAVRLKRPFLEK